MDLGKMTDEQLIELLREGKTEITDYLMEKYKDMVRKQARAMYLWGGENDDLIQEGMIGLFKAVQDYDPKEGASFSSFAGLCVSRQMYTAIKASWLNPPRPARPPPPLRPRRGKSIFRSIPMCRFTRLPVTIRRRTGFP